MRAIVLLAVATVTTTLSSARADERTVTVGLYENEPKVFTSKTGKPAGIFVDVIEHVANSEGWRLRYVSGTWAQGLERLAKGEIDLMPDVALTAEREQSYSFNKVPVLSSWSQVYARKNSDIRSLLDLNGKRVATLQGSVQQEAFMRLSEGFGLRVTLIPTTDYRSVLARVATGEADAAITNNFFGLMHIKEYGLADTAVVFSPTRLMFAAPKNAPVQLLDAIDQHLVKLKENSDSAYYASLKRWTSEEATFRPPRWLQVVGFAVVVILTISLMGSAILKRQVNLRTQELRQINQEMERRIVARTVDLAAAMEKAQAADHIKSAFLATMSHELRTPLNSIIGFTGIMIQGLPGPLNEEQRKQMTMVQNSARHLLSLISDVLDISKIEAGELTLSRNSFDLRASIEKTVKLMSPLADKKGIKLQMSLPDTPAMIETDQRRLEQVILNLLNNAVKFTDTGHVRVSCRNESGQLLVSVADTGVGIQPQELPRLFLPFHQIDSGLARKHEGTGLGLSICKKILDMMGGSIGVQSQWGQGSTFSFSLGASEKRSGESEAINP